MRTNIFVNQIKIHAQVPGLLQSSLCKHRWLYESDDEHVGRRNLLRQDNSGAVKAETCSNAKKI